MENLKSCEFCGVDFGSKRTDAKFCSETCKQKAYLERKAEGEQEPEANKRKIAVNLLSNLPSKDDSEEEKVRKLRAQCAEIMGKDPSDVRSLPERSSFVDSLYAYDDEQSDSYSVKEANEIVKKWVSTLLKWHKRQVSINAIKGLLQSNELFKESVAYEYLPKDYKYRKYIDVNLKTMLKRIIVDMQIDEIDITEFRLDKESRNKLKDVLYDLGI